MRSDSTDKGPQESEKLYRMLFDYSMDGIILVDPRDVGKILSANPAACQMLGWTEEELIGKGREVMFDLEDPALSSLLDERARSGSVRAQLTYRRKDGTTFPGEVSTAFFTDDNGEPRAVAIIRDITERKQAEQALSESEMRFRTMFEAHGAPMLLIEPDSGKIIDANDAAVRFYEYSREQLRAMRIDEINQLPPEEVTAERYKAVERGRNVFIFRHRLASGDVRWVEVYSSPVTIKGQPILFSIIHDITERKQTEKELQESEERFAVAFRNIPDALVISDVDTGLIVDVNDAWTRIWGYSREESLGRRSAELGIYVNFADRERCMRILEKEGLLPEFEIELCTKKGALRHAVISTEVLKFQGGQLMLTVIRDITERKQAEEALQQSRNTLHAIIDTAPVAIVVAQADGEIILANANTQRILGGSVTGDAHGPMGGYKITMPDGTPVPAGRLPLSLALEGQTVTGTELLITRYDGTQAVVLASATPLQKDHGEPWGSIAVLQDITERKRAEENLQQALTKAEEGDQLLAALMEYVPVGITIADASGKLRIISRYGEELLGGVCADKSVGELVNQLPVYQPDGITPMAIDDLPLVKAIQRGEVVRDAELVQLNKYGEKLFLLCNAAPIRDAEGNITGGIVAWNNITERKQLEEQIRQRAEELEIVMEVAPVGIWIGHDPQSHNITGNRMASEFYEAEAGENVSANNTHIRRFFHEGRELAADELPMQEASLKDIDVRNVELDILLPSGEYRTMLGSASPLHDDEGHVRGSVGTFVDITARKEAEAKLKETLDNLDKLVKKRTIELQKAYNLLKESERGLAEAQRMAHLGNWEWDIATDKVYWSDEIYRIFGLNPQEGITYDKFLSLVHPDDRDYVYNSNKEVFNGKTYATEYRRIVRPDGEERIVHSEREVVFDEGNKPIRVRGTVQDITGRKQAEDELKRTGEELKKRNQEIINERQRLYNVLETLPVAIVLLTPDHHISFANRVFRDKFGELDSRHCYDFCFGLSKPCEFCEAFKVLETGKPHHWEATMPDGSVLDVYDLPFTDIDGSLKVLEMDVDITERKRAEEALANLEKIRIKEIHHRIKNNLQVISSLLDLQSESFSHLDVCKVPKVIEAFTESQNRVISMALIHEELYKGEKIDTLEFSAYLRKLTAELFSSYNLRNKNIDLKLDLEQVDLGMDTAIPLGIIVNELVSNAFKHAFPDRREGEIKINLCKTETTCFGRNISNPDKDCMEKDGFMYKLEVSDNGKGMPEEMDIEDSNSLGLQLVSLLVEQIDGCVEVKRDEGTEFTIWFNNIEG